MGTDLLDLLVRFNLALSAGVALVLLIRAPARRWFGARVAYGLWILPIAAGLACFIPARRIAVAAQPAILPPEHAPALAPVSWTSASLDVPPQVPSEPLFELPVLPVGFVVGVWGAGALFFIAVLAFRQFRFVRSLGALQDLGAGIFRGANPKAGPAVVGVIQPIIVTPSDFEERYDARERDAVLAHERAHMAQGDPLVNAIMALMQAVNWFNPLVHVAARALRVDQELACDEAVVGAQAGARRHYAEAMLKTHAAPLSAPLGCAWPGQNFHPLKERIAMLKRTLPSRAQRMIGVSAVAIAALAAGGAAWSAQPASYVAIYADAPAPPPPEDALAAPDAPAPMEHDVHNLDALEGGADEDWDLHARESRREIEEAMMQIEESDRVVREEVRIEIEEAHEIERQARIEAREAARQAQLSARDAELQARVHAREAEIQARVEAELTVHGEEMGRLAVALSAQAMQLANAELNGGLSESERARLEADIEAQALRIGAMGVEIGARALEIETRVRAELDGAEEE